MALIVVDDGTKSASKRITKLAYRNRFLFDEKVGIESASENDPMIRVLLKDIDAATYISLDDLSTIQGLDLLVDKELLSIDRKSEILNLPIAESEIYQDR